jgi:hypothetical protein
VETRFGAEIARHADATRKALYSAGERNPIEKYCEASEESEKARERQEVGSNITLKNGALKQRF